MCVLFDNNLLDFMSNTKNDKRSTKTSLEKATLFSLDQTIN